VVIKVAFLGHGYQLLDAVMGARRGYRATGDGWLSLTVMV